VIRVEVKVVGMLGADFLAVAEFLELPDDTTVRDALAAVCKTPAVPYAAAPMIRAPQYPFFVAINDERIEGEAGGRALTDGDVVSLLQLASSG
jgi:hypothetical protein